MENIWHHTSNKETTPQIFNATNTHEKSDTVTAIDKAHNSVDMEYSVSTTVEVEVKPMDGEDQPNLIEGKKKLWNLVLLVMCNSYDGEYDAERASDDLLYICGMYVEESASNSWRVCRRHTSGRHFLKHVSSQIFKKFETTGRWAALQRKPLELTTPSHLEWGKKQNPLQKQKKKTRLISPRSSKQKKAPKIKDKLTDEENIKENHVGTSKTSNAELN